jgi:cytochrome c6
MKRRLVFIITCLLLVIISASVRATDTSSPGKELFENKCSGCHGTTGKLGKWGAKDLTVSKLDDQQLLKKISNGKGIMPAWKNRLTIGQINLVINYIKTLRS